MGDMKECNTHRERERERERERHKEVSLISNSYNKQQQPLQKVTKSLYIVTHLGQLPFMLITQMARTWALKEDSVNTSIIHWYSTDVISTYRSILALILPTASSRRVHQICRVATPVRGQRRDHVSNTNV